MSLRKPSARGIAARLFLSLRDGHAEHFWLASKGLDCEVSTRTICPRQLPGGPAWGIPPCMSSTLPLGHSSMWTPGLLLPSLLHGSLTLTVFCD